MSDVAEQFTPSSSKNIVGMILIALLIAAAVVGYMWWRDGFSGNETQIEDGQEVADVEAQPLAEPTGMSSPEAEASAAVQEAAEVVERVTDQQGGLEQRLEAAEQRLSRLDQQASAAAGNAARAEGLLIALATRRAIEKGAELGFLADQLRLRFGDGWPNAVSTIISMSRDPVTLDNLVLRLEGLEPELRTSSEEPSFDRLRRELSELFIVRRETTPSPQPMRRMERARLFLESGRYESAIEEIENMPGAPAAERWVEDTRRYAAAQRSIDVIETAALLERGKLRDGAGNAIGDPSPVQGAPDSVSE